MIRILLSIVVLYTFLPLGAQKPLTQVKIEALKKEVQDKKG